MNKPEEELVSIFVSAISCSRLHPVDHENFSLYADQSLNILKDILTKNPLVIKINDKDKMLFNGRLVSLELPDAKELFLRLRRKKIVKVTVSNGVQADELKSFLTDLAFSGSSLNSYANIVVKGKNDEPLSNVFSGVETNKGNLLHVKRIYQDITTFKSINMKAVEALIGGLLANIRKGELIQNMLVPVRSDGNELYAHSANTAMLTIFQTEHLGLGTALLYDIGLAALLHDAGKLMLPNNLLHRQDFLNEEEWASMKKHPICGAILLSSLSKVPDVAITVAYEHHMKYDGTGYPETKKRAKKQHIISQIVAIADFYCALSSGLTHRKPLSHASIIGLLIERAGKEFNPLLVDNFVKSFKAYGDTSP